MELDIQWETDWNYDAGEEIQYLDISPDAKNYRVDRWVYRLGWADESDGVFFVTLIGAVAYAEKKARDRDARYRVVKL